MYLYNHTRSFGGDITWPQIRIPLLHLVSSHSNGNGLRLETRNLQDLPTAIRQQKDHLNPQLPRRGHQNNDPTSQLQTTIKTGAISFLMRLYYGSFRMAWQSRGKVISENVSSSCWPKMNQNYAITTLHRRIVKSLARQGPLDLPSTCHVLLGKCLLSLIPLRMQNAREKLPASFPAANRNAIQLKQPKQFLL